MIERVVEFIEESLVPAIESLAEWFEGLPSGMQDTILAMLGIIAVAGPLLILIGKIVPGLKSLISLFRNLTKEQLLSAAGFAALGGAAMLAVNMIANWQNMTWVEKLLSALAVGALIAAAAVTVFHASWSLGIAVGAIAAGVVAGLAAINAAAKEVMPEEELNFTSDNIGTFVDDMGSYSLPEYDTSGGGASYNDTTYSDQYNVTVNVTSPGATAEEIAAAVGREIATLAQSRR